jgi:hypothetical protein
MCKRQTVAVVTRFRYNLCRVHQTLRFTLAMEAELTDHIWTIGELLDKESLELAA